MTKPLVVVESPTKVKTIKKYLGKDFNIAATVGHIKDLPHNEMGIDIEDKFKPKYKTISGKQKIITSLKKAAGNTTDVYLAPDPDREGEAIAWHTAEVLKKKGRSFHRVLFHELTKKAIHDAMAEPIPLNRDKYEAQQARRILDRLVGYELSPLLWRKVKRGLSAGRVQSVAVRMICERERAIQAFEPEEYWTITADVEGDTPPQFTSRLSKKNGKKIKIPDEQTAMSILDDLRNCEFYVQKVAEKAVQRNPRPPFTTSKLQQEAINKLKFSAKKTMVIAQQLYEGIELGPGEPVGLITYMRTDSTRISQDAANEAIKLVAERFGESYAMKKPRFFKNRKKVQDAHEAIRPTSVFNTPDTIAGYLTKDQLNLYRLIWERFVASQMTPAIILNKSVTIQAAAYQLQASGSTVKFPGFMALYQSEDDTMDAGKKRETLPPIDEGSRLKVHKFDPRQHFTSPPPRFSEASLVKELEENGIGRPSTYATILSTIREKGYVNFAKGYFSPSELGFIVNDLIVESFPDIINVDFSAEMEDQLDRVEAAEMDSLKVLDDFYKRFKNKLDLALDNMMSMKGVGIPTELVCPKCKKKLHIKVGKNGHFLACSGYPECDYSTDYVRDERGKIKPAEPVDSEAVDAVCEKCGKPMLLKRGKFGTFLACSGYPECRHTQSLSAGASGKSTGVKCPNDNCDGEIVERTSKRGKTFYGCNRFPDCKFAIWDRPVDQPCPKCGARFLVEKTTKKLGTFLACHDKACGYKEI